MLWTRLAIGAARHFLTYIEQLVDLFHVVAVWPCDNSIRHICGIALW